jgi:uncharacterized protein YrrD
MRRGKDVVGLPVITRDNGAKVGKVEDAVLDRGCTKVLGLLVDEAGWFSAARVVAWASLLVVGLDAVIIDQESSVKKASDVPEMKEVLERGYVLKGLELQTTQGQKLGKIEEFYFNPSTGVVVGFELSGGRERSFVPTPPSFETGQDVAFVDSSVEGTITTLKEALRDR